MKRLIALTIAALSLLFAVGASASVLIYQNDFSAKQHFQRIVKLEGGGKCKHSWQNKRAFEVRVNAGRHDCLYTTPVEGDSKQPDMMIQARAKVLDRTHKKIRDKVYIGLALRANRKSAYELRVFPKGRTYELIRNGILVDSGKNDAIASLDQKNQMRLSADGRSVVAKVNGTRLAGFEDEAIEEVRGQQSGLIFGSEAKPNKDGFGVFDNVKVFLPNP